MFYPIRKLSLLALLFAADFAMGDVLYMKNGDQITGDIKRVWDGEVTIEPTYTDEFAVDLSEVDYIESDREFDIELSDGREMSGQFPGKDESGNQVIQTASESASAPLANFFEVEEPQDDFEWESNIEFSAALNRGNTESENFKMKADTSIRIRDHRQIGEVTFFREELAGLSTQEKDLYKYGYNWLFRDPWFFSANVSYERDPIIELHSRIIASAGVGIDIWNTPRRVLSVQLGYGGQQEDIGLDKSGSSVLTWSLRYQQEVLNDDLEIYHNQTVTENMTGRDNTSVKTTTGLRYEFNDTMFSTLSIDYDYESDPVDLADNEDIAILVGIGLEF